MCVNVRSQTTKKKNNETSLRISRFGGKGGREKRTVNLHMPLRPKSYLKDIKIISLFLQTLHPDQ